MPAPEWFQDAKFGVYWHWGAFTTPQYGSEWYGRDMYRPGSRENDHHRATYGDPREWGYDRFIDGGVDTAGNHVLFAPKLVSQGGKFDPEDWARTVKASGAPSPARSPSTTTVSPCGTAGPTSGTRWRGARA